MLPPLQIHAWLFLGFAKEISLFPVEEMVYSVGSGAAEIACGLHPTCGQITRGEEPAIRSRNPRPKLLP